MKRLSLVLLTTLAMGGVALAEEPGKMSRDSQTSDKMKGPPNADGAQKAPGGATNTTGSAGEGAATAKATGEAEDKKPGAR